MEESENSEKKETIIFFEEEPHTVSDIYVSKDGKYIITYDQVNDSLLGWIADENDVRTDNEIGIFKIERQQEDLDKNLLFKITSIKTKISMIVFDDRGYEIVDLRTKHQIICPSQFYNTKPEFLEFTSIDELIIFVEEEQTMYLYLVNFKKNMWIKKMSLKIRTFMEDIGFFGIMGENYDEEMDRIVRIISPDSNSTCIYLITNNGMLLLDRETKTIEIRITFDLDFKKKEKKRIINIKSIRTGLVVRTFTIQSLESSEEGNVNEKWYIIRSFDCLYIIAFINTKILLLNIINGSKYVITNDLNEEIKAIINENLSNFNIFTIYAPDNTLFGIQHNKILKKGFRNLDFGKFFYNQNLEVLIWDSYLNIQEPDANLYSISPDIQELKRVKQLPVDAIKRRSCENELVKWSWVDKELKVELKSDDESKSPEYKIEVGECMDLMMEIIYNTDLIINTGEELCIFHFDLNMKSVTLQYYWRIFSKNEDSFIPFNLENILFLPRTDFLKSLNSGYLSDVHELWIDTIVEDKFSLAAYGKDLMICLIYIRASFLVDIVLDKWIKWFIESPRENFYFLKIISILYSELYKSFPEHMKKFNDTLKFSLDKELSINILLIL
ncbi:42755_t:CDS:2 [Gigaspora margarita]|uniref:42755_t:CDS:1 n=1 Tax=Gigaspora margarita TaxID=4874 RepID=A0ABN7V3A9_GIGMA|nr:42755_t:CDS:2 [Gigaspora margarita]